MSEEMTHDEVTEENTAPDATGDSTPADEEVGETDVNFTTEAGTPEAPASLSDGTEDVSSDSTTSPSLDADAEPVDPKPLGDSEDSFGAQDANNSATDSEDAPSTDDGDDEGPESDAQKSLKGEPADGEGMTHCGTDTPEKLVSNPYDNMTGEAIFKEDTHSDEPLHFNSFSDKQDEDADSKCSKAIELIGEVRNSL
ncbi:MAG: hypothetical protein EOO38_00215 [Cytophagaceae bacterium]|nr:MAG: hypothetical protein EOO38_00215 [Cytophagaceae bacterium]